MTFIYDYLFSLFYSVLGSSNVYPKSTCRGILQTVLSPIPSLLPQYNMFAVQIQPIKPGQRIQIWGQSFTAATATLSDDQKRGLLPAYVQRSSEETLLAVEASKEGTLAQALVKLEELIDGKPDQVEEMKAFLEARHNEGPPIGYLKTLCDRATRAGIGLIAAWLKFCAEIEGGQKIHKKMKGKVKPESSFNDMASWLAELNTTLKPKTDPNSQVKVKEELFTVSALGERLAAMEARLDQLAPSESEESEEECAMVCYKCGREGHIKKNCNVTVKCKKCGKKGHLEKACRNQRKRL